MAIGSRVVQWWTILRISLEERLVYRADFALGTLMRFMPIITQILLIRAVFESSGRERIAGFTNNDVVAYYLMVLISRAFSSMPTLASGIAMEIREGDVKRYLVQPVDMIGFLLLKRIAWKLIYYTVALGPFALVFYLCRGFFPGWPDAVTMTAYVTSLLLAFLIGFFLEALIGMIGFWFLEVSSLLFIYMLLNFILSGHMFPLDFLQQFPIVQTLFTSLPFQYLAYFPAAVFLGKISGPDLVYGLIIQASWAVAFFVACRLAYALGVRHYSGYGG